MREFTGPELDKLFNTITKIGFSDKIKDLEEKILKKNASFQKINKIQDIQDLWIHFYNIYQTILSGEKKKITFGSKLKQQNGITVLDQFMLMLKQRLICTLFGVIYGKI